MYNYKKQYDRIIAREGRALVFKGTNPLGGLSHLLFTFYRRMGGEDFWGGVAHEQS